MVEKFDIVKRLLVLFYFDQRCCARRVWGRLHSHSQRIKSRGSYFPPLWELH